MKFPYNITNFPISSILYRKDIAILRRKRSFLIFLNQLFFIIFCVFTFSLINSINEFSVKFSNLFLWCCLIIKRKYFIFFYLLDRLLKFLHSINYDCLIVDIYFRCVPLYFISLFLRYWSFLYKLHFLCFKNHCFLAFLL